MGVCKIENIKAESFGRGALRQFYVLKPIYDNNSTTLYVPTDSKKIVLKPLIDEKEIKDLLRNLDTTNCLWVENDVQRKDVFTKILKSGDRSQIILLIKELHEQKLCRQQTGKRLHISDEKFLREAEKLIHEELAFSMNIAVDDVSDFIMK